MIVPARLTPNASGVVVVDGFGIRLAVERNHLVLSDGIGRRRREGRYPRAGSGLRRVVVIGATGSVSFAALQFLHDTGIGYTQFDPAGELIAASGDLGRDEPRLRRLQSAAIDTPVGDDIARWLIERKISGQIDTLAELGRHIPIESTVTDVLHSARSRLRVATSRDEIRQAESIAAASYFSSWAALPVRFARRDIGRVPDGWLTAGPRTSPLTASPRLPVTPVQAILGYLYAVLAAEARLACLTVGLDPGAGFLHADQRSRDSAALDIVEPARPAVDRYALELLSRRTFQATDFYQTRQGVCRILEPLSHELSGTALQWRAIVGPIAEHVAARLLADVGAVAPTPISGRNRSRGRGRDEPPRRRPDPKPAASCQTCGGSVVGARRTCDACLPERQAEQVAEFQAAGSKSLAELRAAREDPAHGGGAGEIRGRKRSERAALERGWDASHDRANPQAFLDDILPGLRDLPTRRLVEATGLTRAYCSQIRKGELVPHPRWWATLRSLTG
jgi:CRISPR-associated endonuclease Cas1